MNALTQVIVDGFALSILAALVTMAVISASVLLWVSVI